MDPVLLVTAHVPPDRVAPFAALHARVGIEVLRFGGRTHHATADAPLPELPFRVSDVTQREVFRRCARSRRAVIAGSAGRLALPAAWAGARRARVPFVFWTALWRHPRTLAHLLSWPLLAALHRRADAVATYGPHVSAHARRQGARRVVEAPQPVDVAFWSAPPTADERRAPYQVAFVGRADPEKGLHVLLAAWGSLDFRAPDAALLIVGGGRPEPDAPTAGAPIFALGGRSPEEVRNFLGASDVLVVPSLPTRSWIEPWGLVVNEGMLQDTTIIASDAVGAAAGGLVRGGETGRVVPAGDAAALARVLRELAEDPQQRRRLAARGAQEARRLTPEAWADGMQQALMLAGVDEGRC